MRGRDDKGRLVFPNCGNVIGCQLLARKHGVDFLYEACRIKPLEAFRHVALRKALDRLFILDIFLPVNLDYLRRPDAGNGA